MSHIAFYSNVPPLDCPASAITWQCGATDSRVCYDDRKWRHEIYQQLPTRFSVRIATNYKSIFEQKGRFVAKSYMRKIEKLLNQIDFGLEKIALKLNLANKRNSNYITNENLNSIRQQVESRVKRPTPESIVRNNQKSKRAKRCHTR